MIFRSGYLTLGSLGGITFRIHWTTPVGAYALTGFDYVPRAWLRFLLPVLPPQLRPAVLVRVMGCRVIGIDVHGLGGQCEWQGHVSERQRAGIAWGGVLGQTALLLTTPLWATHLSPETRPFVAQLVSAFTGTNLLMAIF